jgi:hypothetical protein
MWINNLEFEILKRIRYELSFDNLAPDKNQLFEILHKLKNIGIINFRHNVAASQDIFNPQNLEITKKGNRIFIETNYDPL